MRRNDRRPFDVMLDVVCPFVGLLFAALVLGLVARVCGL